MTNKSGNKNEFVYQCPTERGMVKLPVSLRALYKMGLGYRGNPLFIKADVYADNEKGVIEYRTNFLGLMIGVLTIPLFLVVNGFNSETFDSIKRGIFQTKYGSFSSDEFSKYDRIGANLCAMVDTDGK